MIDNNVVPFIRPGAGAGGGAKMTASQDTILDAFDTYQRSQNLADTTIRNRRSILTTLAELIGKPLEEATIHDLRAFMGRKGLSAGSRLTYRNAVRSFYRFLLEDGYRDDDPSERLPKVQAPKGQPRPFTWEQVEAMLESGAYRRTRIMIAIGYYQGFRVSQIARVHGRDVDLAAGTIRTIGKGGKERTLPLHEVVAELARTMPADDWWFPARGGRTGHIHASSVTDRITRAKIRAGITDPTLTPHSLRHAFGTDLVDEGVDIRVVKELMTHESLATTEIYTAVSARKKREAIAALPARPIPQQSGRMPKAA